MTQKMVIAQVVQSRVVRAGKKELAAVQQIQRQLIEDLRSRVDQRPAGDPRLKKAIAFLKERFERRLAEIDSNARRVDTAKMALLFRLLREASQTLSALEIADRQRLGSNPPAMLDEVAALDNLIASCYSPGFGNIRSAQVPIPLDTILGIFLEDEFLARIVGVPYIAIPVFLRRLPWGWLGIAHEVGHLLYATPMLQDELDIVVGQALSAAEPSLPLPVRRLWFRCLPEVFSDLYGILTMGKAFVYSGQAVYLYASMPPNSQRPEDLAKKLVEGKSPTHPAPLMRGRLGIYAYEKLKDAALPNNDPLLLWRPEVVEPLADEPIPDPAEPESSLVQAEVIKAMETVVNTMLNTSLHTLGCKRLADMVDFKGDETIRDTLYQALLKGELQPQLEESPARKHLEDQLSQSLDQVQVMRYWIAAQRLYFESSAGPTRPF
jgi:hypothetical protein